MPICGRCKKEKENSKFYFYRNKPRHWCKACDRINTIIRQTVFKELCVEYKGGKCENCGYDKYVGALDFHHIDPKQKDFGIGSAKLRKFDNSIKKELDKCQLLCANCHREKHQKYQFKEISELWNWYEEKKQKELLNKPEKDLTCHCGNKKTPKAIQCIKCKDKAYYKRDIEEVIQKIKETNYTQAAKFFSLSDNGLRKFVKSKGYDPKTLVKNA